MKSKLIKTAITIIVALLVYFIISNYFFPNWEKIKDFFLNIII
jgi:hypothetical protein